MLKVKEFLFAYLLRLPFFLLAYTVVLILTRDYSVFYQMLVIFTVMCAIEMLPAQVRPFIVMLGFILTIIFMFTGMYATAVTLFIFLIYRPEQIRTVGSIIMIAVLFILTVIASIFVDPEIGNICIRNLVIAVVAKILAKQAQTLDRFLGSYYCRGVSQKTASSIIKRSYLLTIACLAGFIAVGFLARSNEEVVPVPDLIIQRVETAYDQMFDALDLRDPEEREEPVIDVAGYVPLRDPPRADNQPGMVYLLVAAIAITVVALFVLLHNKWYINDNRFEDYDDIIEETAVTPEKSLKKSRHLLNLGMNYTIRRLFKRKVKEYITTKSMYTQKSDTPKKLAEKISEWEDIDPLKTLYQKARYSGEQVKRNELNILKK